MPQTLYWAKVTLVNEQRCACLPNAQLWKQTGRGSHYSEMQCGNEWFGELLIEDSTYLGDQKRLPRGSDV